jgi:predicted RNA-binding Zn ribbon-like protein
MQTPETIKLMGGALCVDFANSVDWDGDEPIADEDALADDDAVARWGRRMGLWAGGDHAGAGGDHAGTGSDHAGAGGDAPGASGDVAARELAALRDLRPRLRAALIAGARGDAAPTHDLDALAAAYAEAIAAAHLAPADGAYRPDWPADDLRRVRFAVVADAISLLGDPERLERVHMCPGRRCGWLFVDTSGRRRWCSMQTCGSRAKMRRMYARRRAA